jgi:hypothetical protein
MREEEDDNRLEFLQLPTEIHEHVIHFCGVADIRSVALVNRQLHNLVQSKLRDLLIAACQNGIPCCSLD